jgi:hypothetical protein
MMEAFLEHKRKAGTAVERAVYAGMTRDQFIDRLLQKRPLMFMTSKDQTLLPGRQSFNAQQQWFRVGTNAEQAPFLLKDYLSYDEMELSAFVNVATPTYFINDGNRNNGGEPGAPGSFQPEGIYIAAVGARFEVPGRMERRYLDTNRSKSNDPMFLQWESLYGVNSDHSLIPGVLDPSVHTQQPPDINRHGYAVRMRMTLEPIILYANAAAGEQGKRAVLRLVGLGLGVWKVNAPEQAKVIYEVVLDVIRKNPLPSIARIEFSWFPAGTVAAQVMNGVVLEQNRANPADPIRAGELLVAVYAWDSNSFPGNEYWDGLLAASGDPAAACCSTIQELQNPFINTSLRSARKLAIYGSDQIQVGAMPSSASSSSSSPSAHALAPGSRPVAAHQPPHAAQWTPPPPFAPPSVPGSSSSAQPVAAQRHVQLNRLSPPRIAPPPVPSSSPAYSAQPVAAQQLQRQQQQPSTQVSSASSSSSSSRAPMIPPYPSMPPPSPVFDFDQLQRNSGYFAQNVHQFPQQTNLIGNLVFSHNYPKESFIRKAEGTSILVHESIMFLMDIFLAYKRHSGSNVERSLYANMTVLQFIDRLLQKRAVVFTGRTDFTVLRTGEKFNSAQQQWFRVGTDFETAPFVLSDYLSYDEMELSAFLNVATPTYFINDGNRANEGRYGRDGTYEPEGIFIGAVGARFQIPGRMEGKYLIEANVASPHDGLSLLWQNFYETRLYPALISNQTCNINRRGYAIRMQMSYEPIILYANEAAQRKGKKAVVRLAGFGLGEWAVNMQAQANVIAEVIQRIIASNNLAHIGKIELLWFPENTIQSGYLYDRQRHLILLEQNRKSPAEPVNPEELLVATYAADSNSLPGNGYWAPEIGEQSGSVAAASCSTIQELGNPLINTKLTADRALIRYGAQKLPYVEHAPHPPIPRNPPPPLK